MEDNKLTDFDTTFTSEISSLLDSDEGFSKLAIKTDVLKGAISKIERSVAKLAVREIDKYIYFEANEEGLTFSAANSQWIIQSIIKNTEKEEKYQILSGLPFSFCILGSLFADIVRKIHHQEMTLTFEEGRVKIETNSLEFFVPTTDTNEFQKVPEIQINSSFTLKSDILNHLYSNTAYAASTTLTRPVLTGINHSIEDKILSCTATDSLRVARIVFPVDQDISDISTTVPASTALEVCKLLGENQDVTVSLSDRTVVYTIDDTVIYAILLAEEYPNLDRLIPGELPIHFDVTHSYLKEAMSFTSLYETNKQVVFMVNPAHGRLRVKTPSTEKGKFKKDIAISGEGDDMSIVFNSRYLQDALKKYSDQDVLRFSFQHNLAPFVLRLKGSIDENLDLLVPIRHPESKMEAQLDDFKAVTEFKAFRNDFATIQ